MSQAGARCGIFRVNAVKRHPDAKRGQKGAANLIGHMLRERINVPNADPARRALNEHLAGPDNIDACLRIIDAAIDTHNAGVAAKRAPGKRRFRTDGVAALDLFFGGSNLGLTELTREQQDSYFHDCAHWAAREFLQSDLSDGRIITCDIHRDEKTPHMHMMIVPSIDGWMCGNSLIGGSEALHEKQNRFYADVSSKYGLERGEIGSAAKHVPAPVLHAKQAFAVEKVREDRRLQLPAPPRPVPDPQPRGVFKNYDKKEVKAQTAYTRELETALSSTQQAAQALQDELISSLAEPNEFKLRRSGIRELEEAARSAKKAADDSIRRQRNRARRAIAIAKAAREKSRRALDEAAFQGIQNSRELMRNLETERALDARQANLDQEVKKRAEARAEELTRARVEERTQAEKQRLEQAQRECNQTQTRLQQEMNAIPSLVAQQVRANTQQRSRELAESLRKCESERTQLRIESNSLQAEKKSFEGQRADWVDWYEKLKAFDQKLRVATRNVNVFTSKWWLKTPKAHEALSMGTEVLKNVLTAACQLAYGQPEEVEKAETYLKQLYPDFPSIQGIDAVDINTLAGPRPPVIPECPAIPEHLLSSLMTPPTGMEDRKSSRRTP